MLPKKNRLIGVLIVVAMCLTLLCGCGEKNINPAVSSPSMENNSSESSTDEKEMQQTEIDTTSVVSPNFSLTNGFIIPVEQQSTAPDGYIAIKTAEEFLKIGLNPTGFYILLNDIDLSEYDYEPVEEFSGIFDGNGYLITKNSYDPLFESVEAGGVVRNLGVYISNNSAPDIMDTRLSGIVGWLKEAEIDNCYFDGNISLAWDLDSPLYQGADINIGGVVGGASASMINNCFNSCDITTNAGDYIGGIAYQAYTTSISNCFNEGNINVGNAGIISGIVGMIGGIGGSSLSELPATVIEGCYNSGNLSGKGIIAGITVNKISDHLLSTVTKCFNSGELNSESNNCYGIGDSSSIDNCYNTGNLSGNAVYGIGRSSEDGHISFCYNTGLLTSTREDRKIIGGVCADESTADNCYFLDTAQGATPNGALFSNVKQLTDSEMQSADSYQGFDFTGIWEMGGATYPYPIFKP